MEQPLSKTNEFKIERYKYILVQIQILNQNVHKYLTVFQTLATAIVGGGVALFVSWERAGIPSEVAITAMESLNWILLLLGIFVLFSLIAGGISWFHYRIEETDLLNEIHGEGFRKKPKIKNFWRWSETYLIMFIIIIEILITSFIRYSIIPLMV